jgi:long-subunit fatty acid transport protein
MIHTQRPIRRIFLFIAFVLILVVPYVDQPIAQPLQRVEVPSSMNPVGSGARALGMGGAFIAVADDATAASWNPGGLIQLETPEISIVGAYFSRTEDNSFSTNPEASGEEGTTGSNINYLSAAYPFSLLNRNMIVSINYQYLFDFSRKWNFPLNFIDDSGGTILESKQKIDIDQDGSLGAVGIAYAAQVTPTLSFGFTLNFWEDALYRNEWEMKTRQTGSGSFTIPMFASYPFNYSAYYNDRYTFQGFNFNLGMLWNPTSRLTIGAVYKSPFTADLTHEYESDVEIIYPDFPAANVPSDPQSGKDDQELDVPMAYGIGVAFRFSDAFTASVDVYRTEWDDYVLTTENGDEISPINGEPADDADIEPTHQVRLGAEYLHITDKYVIPIRGGLFYDPAPADGEPDKFYGFSLGSGIARGRFVFDTAYQYRFGNDVGEFILEDFNFSQDVKEHTLYASVIVHF